MLFSAFFHAPWSSTDRAFCFYFRNACTSIEYVSKCRVSVKSGGAWTHRIVPFFFVGPAAVDAIFPAPPFRSYDALRLWYMNTALTDNTVPVSCSDQASDDPFIPVQRCSTLSRFVRHSCGSIASVHGPSHCRPY